EISTAESLSQQITKTTHLSMFFHSEFPEHRILDERVVGIETGEDETRHTIQPTCARHEHFEESETGMGDQLVRMKALLLFHHSASHEISVPIHFVQVMIQVPEWILEDMLLEIA